MMTRTPALRALPILAAAIVLIGYGPGVADAASFSWKAFAPKDDAWYRSDEAARVAENVLSNQSDRGDWPKNIDTSARPYQGDRPKIKGTFDNGATTGEARFLARAFRVTGREPYRAAFLKALDQILAAPYPNGGWPQASPPTGYASHITFNDNTILNLLEFVRDVARSDEFAFVDEARRSAASRAFDAGIGCILACQVAIDGRPTVWCAQHDETTLEPAKARAYELPSLSGSESGGLLKLLMSLDRPSPEVVRAIDAGAAWYESSKIEGLRETIVDGDKVMVPDPDAPPLWARFYDLKTGKPFFCGRDGVKKETLAEIEPERRNGYSWYGEWGSSVLSNHARWKQKRAREASR